MDDHESAAAAAAAAGAPRLAGPPDGPMTYRDRRTAERAMAADADEAAGGHATAAQYEARIARLEAELDALRFGSAGRNGVFAGGIAAPRDFGRPAARSVPLAEETALPAGATPGSPPGAPGGRPAGAPAGSAGRRLPAAPSSARRGAIAGATALPHRFQPMPPDDDFAGAALRPGSDQPDRDAAAVAGHAASGRPAGPYARRDDRLSGFAGDASPGGAAGVAWPAPDLVDAGSAPQAADRRAWPGDDDGRATGAAMARHDALARLYAAKQDHVRAELPDYDRVVAAGRIPVSPALAAALVESEHTARLEYHLARNPERLAELNRLSPRDAIRAVGRLEAAIGSPAEARATRAPAPLAPLRGGAAGPLRSLAELAESDNAADYIELRRAQRRG